MITIVIVALGIWGYSAWSGYHSAVIGRIPKLPTARALLPCAQNIE